MDSCAWGKTIRIFGGTVPWVKVTKDLFSEILASILSKAPFNDGPPNRWGFERFYNSVASFLNLWIWSDLFIGKFYFLLLSPPNLNPSVSDIVSKFLESYKELPSGLLILLGYFGQSEILLPASVVNSLRQLWTKWDFAPSQCNKNSLRKSAQNKYSL